MFLSLALQLMLRKPPVLEGVVAAAVVGRQGPDAVVNTTRETEAGVGLHGADTVGNIKRETEAKCNLQITDTVGNITRYLAEAIVGLEGPDAAVNIIGPIYRVADLVRGPDTAVDPNGQTLLFPPLEPHERSSSSSSAISLRAQERIVLPILRELCRQLSS